MLRGVHSAAFSSTTVFLQASAGPGFQPVSHPQGAVPRYNLPDDANGLTDRVCELLWRGGDSLAVNFINPSAKVSDRLDGACNIFL